MYYPDDKVALLDEYFTKLFFSSVSLSLSVKASIDSSYTSSSSLVEIIERNAFNFIICVHFYQGISID